MQSLKSWCLVLLDLAREDDHFMAQEVLKVDVLYQNRAVIQLFTLVFLLKDQELMALIQEGRFKGYTTCCTVFVPLPSSDEIPLGMLCPNSPIVFALAKFTIR